MTEMIERVAKAAGISRAKARLALKAMREPTTEMWDQGENASIQASFALDHADTLQRQKKRFDKALSDDAYSFPTLRIWLGVVFWRAMIDAALNERATARHLMAAKAPPPPLRTT